MSDDNGTTISVIADGVQSVLREYSESSDLEHALDRTPTTLEEALSQLALVKASMKLRSPSSNGNNGNKDPLVSSPYEPATSRIAPLSIDESKLLPRGRSDSSSASGDEHHHRGAIEEYFKSSIWKVLGKRLPWLVALLLLQSFSAAILHAFDALLEKHLVIAVFIPMLVGTGGNAGNQPGVMVTRALSMGSIPIRQLLKREFILACLTATLLSLLGFLRVLAEYPKESSSALVISCALFLVILISVFLGIGFSIGLDKVKQCDPADGAAPLLTTISDLIGISCLCAISYTFLG